MSALQDLFEGTNGKTRPTEAKKIPALAVNYFDTTNGWQMGFVNQIKNLSSLTSGNYISAGLPTLFTSTAMNEFTRQWALRTVPPQGFVTPTIGFTGLQRWTTSSKYWQPGQAINP